MIGHFGKVFDRKFRATHGQAMTEYIIIVSLVAIACITAVTVFGQKIAGLFKSAVDSLKSGTPQTNSAGSTQINTNFGLGSMTGSGGS